MGLLAPLSQRECNERILGFSTGLAALPTALLFLFFGLAAFAMWFASTPLLEQFAGDAPWLSYFVPRGLFAVAVATSVLSLAIAGFVQTVCIDRSLRSFFIWTKIWGIGVQKKRVDFDAFEAFEMKNVTSRFYRPEENPQSHSVGYWELVIRTKAGKRVRVERAPRLEEIEALKKSFEAYISLP